MDPKPLLEVLERHPEIRLAYLFGSAAEGRERDASDLDLGVLVEEPTDYRALDQLQAELERAAGRDVDLVDLRKAPPLLAHHVVSRGILLVSRDEDDRVAFTTKVVAKYLDTAHLRRVQHEYLRERAEARHAASR
jgi:predicted nucleotidyltransferase